MECTAVAHRTMLVALGVSFGLGGPVVMFLELLLCACPRRHKAARPTPDHLTVGGHPARAPLRIRFVVQARIASRSVQTACANCWSGAR